ncbi:glycoside hydrolase family 3 N-terminal domain-containing protein [Brooklawnia cerclae]|uniref:Beta-N-acetylhexosaminidase n=1 Tax=Brooklawnia cerclae TaxID=349934 RepID=A0ABX0SK37_9ACTN|nr:glycoside hydrolase family 3 protein [Brooklawnia cerclae]NIH58345.1 beta-N-acetylhexosaminidase [Brooklawnia cerclae]
MSLAHGVLMPGFPGTSIPSWLAEALDAGLAGVVLFAENTPSVEATRRITDAVHAIRPQAVVSCDEEGGDVTRLQASSGSSLPGNAALGVLDDPALTRETAAAYGHLIAMAGIDLALSPCLDVAGEPLNPVIGVRSFGASAELVGRHGRAFVAGLADAGVASCGKHFPGHGDTKADSHLSLPVLDVDATTLRERDEQPFATARPDAVMTAHIVVPARGTEPASLSAWATGDIRGLGLGGPIITDALGMRAISDRWDMGEACVRALEAGADLLLLDAPHNRDARTGLEEAAAAIDAAVASGRLRAADLRASATRNATLARPGRPDFSVAGTASLLSRLDGLGDRIASAALVSQGDVRLRGTPVLVDLRRRVNHASGSQGNPLLTSLRARDPRTLTADVDGLSSVGDAQQVVALTRQPLGDPEEGRALARLLEARPDAVVVHTGTAAAAPRSERLVLTHGGGAANARAAVAALMGAQS